MTVTERKPWVFIGLFWLLALAGGCPMLTAAEPSMTARAALALAAATDTNSDILSKTADCGCTNPADCSCGSNCQCPNCASHAQKTSTVLTTCKADDGGPDWTLSADGKSWWRKMPAQRAFYYQPQPMYFAPPPMMMGGFGGPMMGGCGGGS